MILKNLSSNRYIKYLFENKYFTECIYIKLNEKNMEKLIKMKDKVFNQCCKFIKNYSKCTNIFLIGDEILMDEQLNKKIDKISKIFKAKEKITLNIFIDNIAEEYLINCIDNKFCNFYFNIYNENELNNLINYLVKNNIVFSEKNKDFDIINKNNEKFTIIKDFQNDKNITSKNINQTCIYPFNSMLIDCDGYIYPCIFDKQKLLKLGNIFEDEEIYIESRDNFRKNMIKEPYNIYPCVKCQMHNFMINL